MPNNRPIEQQQLMVQPPAPPASRDADAAGGYQLMESREKFSEVLTLIDENLTAQRFNVLNLPRIKVPAGGAREFRVMDASGEEPLRTLSGVITAFRQARVYWKKAYGSGGGKKPPDCSSTNGFVGVGEPGGECALCPYAQFGTALNPDGSKGAGQACKDIRQLLILLPDNLLPHILNIPPTSIKNFMQYSLNLLSAGAPYWGVVSKLTLEPATSGGGIDYARIQFSLERRVAKEQAASMLKPYHERMNSLLRPMVVDATAYESEEASQDVHAETVNVEEPNDASVPF